MRRVDRFTGKPKQDVTLGQAFLDTPRLSFDAAAMEKTNQAALFDGNFVRSSIDNQ